jgi:ribonuclease P protein component
MDLGRGFIPVPTRTNRSFSYYHRLHRPADFRKFFQGSEVLRLSHGLIFRVANGLEHFRLGFTIKCRATSVQRNSFKRRVREAFRLRTEQVGAFDYNVVVPDRLKLDREGSERMVEEIHSALENRWGRFEAAKLRRSRVP